MNEEANHNYLMAPRCNLDSKHKIVSGGEILVEDIGLVHGGVKSISKKGVVLEGGSICLVSEDCENL